MAEQPRRFFDVWIVETNQVYKEVPYNVVADWVQQGRLLEDDKIKPSGTAEWFRIGGHPAFAAFLPKAEPFRADDQAEALEPVQLGFTWKRHGDEEEDDPDMIPLIDVSLVLLVFFIMTVGGALASNPIKLPQADFADATSDQTVIWIGIDRDADGNAVYSLGRGDKPPASSDDQGLIAQEQVLKRLDLLLEEQPGRVEVNIQANEELPAGLVRKLSIELGKRREKVAKVYTGVRESVSP